MELPVRLKNAIDFLFAEWNNKAAGFVSYGGASGARAVEQLRLVPGGGANGHRAPPSLALHVFRLRKLQRLQARFTKRDVGQRDAGPARRVGRCAKAAPKKTA